MLQHDVFLVVTQNQAFGLWIRSLIQRYGIVRNLSSCAESAPALPAGRRWAGVIVDLECPDHEPPTMIRQVREAHPLVPVLAIGKTATPETVNALHAACAEFAMMPVEERNLGSFARRALVSGQLPGAALSAYVDELARTRGLTPREVQLVVHALASESREDAVSRLGVSANTLKSQVRGLLRKCGRSSLDGLATMILRDVMVRPPAFGMERAAE